MNTSKFATAALLLTLALTANAADPEPVTDADFAPLLGVNWTGHLMYIDYSSGKATKIPATLNVKKLRENRFEFAYGYPDEPHANAKERIAIRDDGKRLNSQNVIARSTAPDSTTIITTQSGIDNNKPATLRYTYTITKDSFELRKDVQPEGQTDWSLRNTFQFKAAAKTQ